MQHRVFISAVIVLLGLVPSTFAEDLPNVLIILSDDHSAAHVGCYGNPDVHTPELDRLSKQGLRFNRAYVTAPQCVPSRASIMTGCMPIEIGMLRFSDHLQADVKILPDYLKKAGYYTGFCGRTYHLDGGLANMPQFRELVGTDLPNVAKRVDYCKSTGDAGETLEQLSEFLDGKPADKPFFLQLCWSDPHRSWDDQPKPDPVDPAQLKLPVTYPDTPEVRQDLASCYDEINRMDANVGKVIETLKSRGLLDNTLIIFQGDNGASQFRGKGTLNELGIHVPLIIRLPHDAQAGTVVEGLVSAQDIVPTVLDFLHLEIPKEVTGKSFAAALRGEPFAGRDYAFAERIAHASALPNNSAVFDLGRVIVGKRYKLIYNGTWQLPYHPVDFAHMPFFTSLRKMNDAGQLDPLHARLYLGPRSMFELYDLKNDPLELTNLAGKKEVRPIERELRKQLSAHMIRTHDYLPPPVPGGGQKGKRQAKQKP